MDINHCLPLFDENVREYHTAKTALSNRTESYGGINVTFGLPPWIQPNFSDMGETSEKNSNQYHNKHLGAPFIQVSGPSPTPPRKETDRAPLPSVPLSAVGTPTMTESYTLPVTKTPIQVELVTGAPKTRDGPAAEEDSGEHENPGQTDNV
ncbi:hypothetical protein VCV18_004871 [Metarhizium anisopliae]